jgi:hypothetical protein
MTIPEIKLKKISLFNFRGAKDLLDLDLGSDCKSCAIFGNNAEGKSTFTQALEWFFTGKIAYLKGEGISDEDIINLASSDDDETGVNLVFNKSELNSSKVYDKKKRKHRYSNNSQIFVDYIENKARYDRLYLDQHTILWFLLQTKGEKKEVIAKIVGYEEIIKIKSTISSALYDLGRNPRLWEAKKNLASNQGIMTKEIYGETVSDTQGLLEKSQEYLEIFGIKEELNDQEQLDKAIKKAFQLLPSQERAKERVNLENIKTRVNELNKIIDIIPAVTNWVSNFNELVKDRENVSKLNLDEFLRQAEKVISDNPDIETCPLCDKPIESQELLLNSVVERYRKLLELRKSLESHDKNLKRLIAEMQEIDKKCTQVSQELADRKISYNSDLFQRYSKNIKDIAPQMENRFKERNTIHLDISTMERDIKDLESATLAINSELTKKISSLAISKEEEQKQATYQKLVRGKELVLENISYENKIAAFDLLIQDLQKIEGQMLELQNSAMREILDLLSDDVNKFFCYLNKRANIKNVRLELKGEEGIEFSLEFFDIEASPPRKYLSESQLNSLGIAFFLAAIKKFNRSNKFFILDDVLVSFDRNYRLRLLDLLDEYFSDYQMLLLTHEEYWFQMMKKKFPYWISKEVNWNFNTGIFFKDVKPDLLENICDKYEKGEKVGNELRTYIESILKDICLALEVKLAFRLGLENEKRMIGEMFSALTGTLHNHGSDIQKSREYKDLEVSNFIVTCSSHHNPDLDSLGDIGETIEKVKKFRSLFICPKGRIVDRKNNLPGQNKISCKCGCLQINWK